MYFRRMISQNLRHEFCVFCDFIVLERVIHHAYSSNVIPGVKNVYKLMKRNLKLITSINSMQIFLVFKQSNLSFELSFVEIHQVLREIWLFEHEFQASKFGELRISGSIEFVNKLFIKLRNSIRVSEQNRKGKIPIKITSSNDLRSTLNKQKVN